MANIPWIGTCRLCARTADKRRWSGDADEAVGILMLLAISKDDFEERVRIVVQEMGYDVIDIHSAYTVSESINYQQHKATIAFHLNDVNETRPVLVGSFVPVMGRFKYDEVTWDDLLDLSAPPLWAVIDGVNWPEAADILGTVGKEDCVCLYSTTNTRSKTFAPWLVRLKLDSAVTKAMKKRAHELNSGILFQSNWPISELRRHLRKFTMAWTPADENAPIYFRFYDPRVLLDVTQALDDSNLGRFLKPFLSLALQLNPLCLVPAEAKVHAPITGFQQAEECHERLLMALLSKPLESKEIGQFKISDTEFAKLAKLQKIRATRKLARRLFFDYQPTVNQTDCQSAAETASEVALTFNMNTVKQVTIIARAVLLFGPDFWMKYTEAGDILNNQTLLPWQKKNNLTKWLAKAYLDPAYTPVTTM